MRYRSIQLAAILAFFCSTAVNAQAAQEKISPASFFFSAGIGSEPADGPSMKQQALATMKRVERALKEAGFRTDEIVFVRAYLTPGQNGVVDYAGWEHGAREFFNNTKSRPARTTTAVPYLGKPGRLIQIECVAVNKNSIWMR